METKLLSIYPGLSAKRLIRVFKKMLGPIRVSRRWLMKVQSALDQLYDELEATNHIKI